MSISSIDTEVQCVATTEVSFSGGLQKLDNEARRITTSGNSREDAPHEINFFRAAQFTSDGTALITHNRDHCLRTFVVPHDLLDEKCSRPRELIAHSTLNSPTPLRSFATYPHFDLRNPSTTLVLAASKDLPITLHNALAAGIVHAKYPLVDPWTEAYGCPTSLLWGHEGTHFVAGGKNQVSFFDASRDNEGPYLVHRTSRKKLPGHAGPRFKGHITALSANSDGLLAAGTTERQVTLLEKEGRGDHVTSFDLSDSSRPRDKCSGTGIMQIAWSPCGKYMLVVERQSTCVQVFDMRNTFARLAYLTGRTANTTQRMGIDITPTAESFEVWAGGTDGLIKLWKDVGLAEGEKPPDMEFRAHEDAISATVWHPRGAILASCSGQRHPTDASSEVEHNQPGDTNDERNQSVGDSSLKLWTWSTSTQISPGSVTGSKYRSTS